MDAPSIQFDRLDPRAVDPQSARIRSLWREYQKSLRAGHFAEGAAGVLWAAVWTFIAWRSSQTVTFNTNPLIAVALAGWLGLLRPLRGTSLAIILRFALLGAAAGLAILVFMPSRSRGAGSSAIVVVIAIGLVALALRGLRSELHERDPRLWTAILDHHRYALIETPEQFLWFVSHGGDAAVRLPAPVAIPLFQRLSERDQAHTRMFCSECFNERSVISPDACEKCGDSQVLFFYTTAGFSHEPYVGTEFTHQNTGFAHQNSVNATPVSAPKTTESARQPNYPPSSVAEVTVEEQVTQSGSHKGSRYWVLAGFMALATIAALFWGAWNAWRSHLVTGHRHRADALFASANLDGAIAEYREAIRLAPGDIYAHAGLGLVLAQKGDSNGAVVEELQAMSLRPNDAQVHRELGWVIGRQGDYEAEIIAEREALILKPDDAGAHRHLGWALSNKGDWDGAITEYTKALQLRPGDADAHKLLGWAYGNKGDWYQEEGQYFGAVRLMPDDSNAHLLLAWSLGRLGDFVGAITHCQEAIRVKPNDAEADGLLGWLLWGKAVYGGDLGESLQMTRRFADRGNPLAELELGMMYDDGQGVAEDHPQALAWVSKAADKGNAMAETWLGREYAEGKNVATDYQLARTLFWKAASQSHFEAVKGLAGMDAKGEGEDVPLEEYQALAQLHKAAAAGDSRAQVTLGFIYENGVGAPKDCIGVQRTLDSASEHLDFTTVDVEHRVAKQACQEARAWFLKAGEQGNADAEMRLGELYESEEDGLGVDEDSFHRITDAIAWYNRAAIHGLRIAALRKLVMECVRSMANFPRDDQAEQAAEAWCRMARTFQGARELQLLDKLMPPSNCSTSEACVNGQMKFEIIEDHLEEYIETETAVEGRIQERLDLLGPGAPPIDPAEAPK